MATIRRHRVPTDSYDPKRPLNDLLLAQLDHFKHIAKKLSPNLRNTVPTEPAIEDREGVDRFIKAITGVHISRKKVRAQPAATQAPALKLAGAADETSANKPARSNTQGKPKYKPKPGQPRSSKR